MLTKGLGEERAILDDAQLPGLICHEETAIGRKLHGGRHRGQAVDEQHILKSGGKSGRRPAEVRRPAGGDEQSQQRDPPVRAHTAPAHGGRYTRSDG